MIRVAVMYKNSPDSSFNMDYYREKHMALVRERYLPHGLANLEVDEAVSKTGSRAAPYIAIAYMTFADMEAFMAAIKSSGKEIMADVQNFTDIEPTVQISNIVAV